MLKVNSYEYVLNVNEHNGYSTQAHTLTHTSYLSSLNI